VRRVVNVCKFTMKHIEKKVNTKRYINVRRLMKEKCVKLYTWIIHQLVDNLFKALKLYSRGYGDSDIQQYIIHKTNSG
jgi:hypothetical protein